ncbi:thioredoxin family protein [Marivirga sp. S37H4]|uniref:Thioredoxin family protein n=1 Tax=Marivirga aurantiaca TaxID=2802615 RepID=A0A934WUV2_9BACT|nr:thioredoxin family protein [Marivirga aurantiaca]MBK6263448.1 thioredoxin family protein [Marivirga aurantiaca]
MKKVKKVVTQDLMNGALDYAAYRNMIKLLLQERKTTGNNHSDEMVAYTKMNDQRMNRWDKTLQINEEVTNLVKALPLMQWLIITEAWCGDAAQNIPFIAKLADLNENINLRLILRDEHPEVMDAYLTNGSRSIPILIMMDESLNEQAKWGPRPEPVQKMVMASKTIPTLDNLAFIESIHKWYADDKMQTLQNEFSSLLKKLNTDG